LCPPYKSLFFQAEAPSFVLLLLTKAKTPLFVKMTSGTKALEGGEVDELNPPSLTEGHGL
jgi:hypothetical protein